MHAQEQAQHMDGANEHILNTVSQLLLRSRVQWRPDPFHTFARPLFIPSFLTDSGLKPDGGWN
jgi:hypothetical protein